MNAKEKCFLVSVVATRASGPIPKREIPKYNVYRGSDKPRIPSLNSGVCGNAPLAPMKVYTGTKMIGVAQMAKSNAVPVFNFDQIEEIARMRR